MDLKKQMKRAATLFLTAVVAAGGCPAQWIDSAGAVKVQAAEDLKYGKMTYFVLDDGTVAIADCEDDISGTLVIPETIDGKIVSRIDKSAFEGCQSLTSITIPKGVTSVGDYDYGYWFAESVFKGCSSLTEICVDEQNEFFTSEDGVLFDKGKEELIYYPGGKQEKSYEIPSGIRLISIAFQDCTCLESITIPSSVESVLTGFFAGSSIAYIDVDAANEFCYSQNGILFSISKGTGTDTDKVYLHTYPGERKEASYTVPPNVTAITYYGMYGCKYLTSVTISNGVQAIFSYSFGECSALTCIELPKTLKSIGEDAFNGCKSLKEIAIPNGVTYIGDRAFYSCESLNSIQIPDSVKKIEMNTFSQCAQKGIPLTIYCNEGSAACQYAKANGIATKPYEDFGKPDASQGDGNPGNSSNGGNGGNSGNGNSGSLPADAWIKGTKQVVSGAVYTSLGNGTVTYTAPVKKTAKSVVIPASIKQSGKTYPVTQISANAFKNNKKLTKVTIGKNVKQIGANAFSGCKKLKTITIKSKVLKKAGKKAFKGIDRKARIKVPKAKLAAYKKLLKGKGQAKSVKVMK